MTHMLLLLPVLIPMGSAVSALLCWERPTMQRWINVVGSTMLLATGLTLLGRVSRGGIIAVQVGSWPAPFGITFVADLLSAIMVTITGIVGLAVAIYSLGSVDAPRESFGYHPLFQVLLMGVCGSFLTGDVFNLYVWFEVMLIASFVLIALGGTHRQLEGAIKYVTLNLFSSAIFLAAVGILYGIAGTLNMADLSVRLRAGATSGLVTTLAIMFTIAFGIKAGVFPLFFWLPASYHTPPAPVSAVFAGLLTKVGVYALIRFLTLLFAQDPGYTHTILLVVAGFTMVTGVLGAVAQSQLRRLLSFHIVSQIGYMVMGLALFTPLALAGSVFYLVHHIIVKTNLFLISGIIHRLRGTEQLEHLGGFYRTHPFLSLLFLIPAFSLAGIPPLSGFWAKLALVQAGLNIGQYLIVAVALVVSLLTLFSMTKIWAEAFWKAPLGDASVMGAPSAVQWSYLMGPVVGLALLTLIIGFATEPFFVLASQAAEQLLNPTDYIRAVLGTTGGAM
jgi:multicomponent Na+:H+ antiporter subunit D